MSTTAILESDDAPVVLPLPIHRVKSEFMEPDSVRSSWAARGLGLETPQPGFSLLPGSEAPRSGDAVVARVDRIGHHAHIETESGRRIRLYAGDRIVGVFGNRYATDVYEGRVLTLSNLHILTASGVVGTVTCRNRDVGRPTAVTFLGYLGDAGGRRINTRQMAFPPSAWHGVRPPAVLVVGTGMSSGKTTVVRKILRAVTAGGVRVAGCKLTGTTSPRDLYEMRSTGAVLATDFSDYGYPSTYGESLENLIQVLDSMTAACGRADAQLAVIEIADGILQPETQMLLESPEIRQRVKGVIVAGGCSSSLLFATEYVQKTGHDVWAASGLMTNAPLFVKEFSDRSSIPVASSRGSGTRLARLVIKKSAPAES